jgi:predicted permease
MSTLISEVRITLRSLARRPAFTVVVLATLGLGIGATTTIYSVVDAVVVRPLPYDEADQLLAIGNTFPGREWDDERADLQHLAGVSLKNFQNWQERVRSISVLGAAERTSTLLADRGDGPELVPLVRVTEDFFGLFRIAPVYGRTFLPDDYAGLNGAVAMLSYGAWMARFGGDPAIIGKPLQTVGTSATVVGVLPEDFLPPAVLGTESIDFWSPIDATHPRYESRGRRTLYVFGRLAGGTTLATARSELDGIQAQLAAEFPDGNVYPNGDRLGAGANSLHADTVGTSRRALIIFFGASAMLLLIAGLNAANLLLVRGLDRQGEMGIRRVLGADRTRLMRGLLTESLLLSFGGGLVGIVIAFGGVEAFLRFAPRVLPRLGEVTINLRIIAITTLVSLAAGVVVGILPAVKLTARDLTTTIKENIGTTVALTGTRLRTALVATQLALAVVLVVGASLLFNSFLRVTMVDPGFNAQNLTVFSMPLKRPNAPEGESIWQAWDGLLREVRSVPGLTAVAATSVLPFYSPQWAPWVLLPGEASDHRRKGTAGYMVTPNFFDVAEIPFVAGRAFSSTDGPGASNVAIVNQEFVRAHLTGQDPIGLPIRFRNGDDTFTELQIVGVVGNVVQTRAEEGPRPAIYVPYTQSDWSTANVVVRSDRDLTTLALELRQAAAQFSPYVPVRNLRSMTSRIRVVRTAPRFQALLLGSFATVALLLAAVGLYGSLAHAVGRRTREMGIRMALGAPRLGIFRLVLNQGLTVTAAGLAFGLAGAVLLTRLLRSFLFEVEALDAVSFTGAVVVLMLVAVLAIVVPARRATSVDVVGSLRAE